jgi:transposase-like protein
MPHPLSCPYPDCPAHSHPPPHWCVRFGRYSTAAHGSVQRYRCLLCGHCSSDQTESVHYFAKRRLPLKAIYLSLLGGASLREIARRYSISCPAVANALLRLGRQSMAAHLTLLHRLNPRHSLVYDGLRSFITSQDFPCDITTVVEAEGETILSMTHTVFRRGGTMRPAQRSRMDRKLLVWRPEAGCMKADISLLIRELWDYLRPSFAHPAVIHTDEHPLYRALLDADHTAAHFRSLGLFSHSRTSGSAARTMDNPLFPVNYVDRLLRHRLKEHTRETIAFGRNATMQMHRAWIFAFDHNCCREHRVRRPQEGSHAEQGAVDRSTAAELRRQFFRRRIRIGEEGVPQSIRRVWMAELATPPVRWKAGQSSKTLRIPGYAVRDLGVLDQQAS